MSTIKTLRFGEIEVDGNRSIHFPDGILGFPENKEYILLEHNPKSPFYWLQCTSVPDLAFVVMNPLIMKADYMEALSKEERAALSCDSGKDGTLLAIVTIPNGRPSNATINLLGPLVIDPDSRTGRQVILAGSIYSHRHPLTDN